LTICFSMSCRTWDISSSFQKDLIKLARTIVTVFLIRKWLK